MFGYVRARTDVLAKEELAAYHAAYCGLCRALSKRYGFRARFLVNYDMTFLYLVLSCTGTACEPRQCWCPARVFGKKPCYCDAEGYSSVAARTVILSWLKLDDNVRDSGPLRSVPYRFLRFFYRRAYRKACRDLPSFAAVAADRLKKLSVLEQARSGSIDAAADAFAGIVSACADEFGGENARRAASVLLYQIGRFIYLTDALDDLSDDCKTDSYNPLRCRFEIQDGKLCPEDEQYLTELTESSVNLAGSALSLLEPKRFGPLLENIVYLGLPAVFAAVKNGSFRSHAKDFPRKEQDK